MVEDDFLICFEVILLRQTFQYRLNLEKEDFYWKLYQGV